MITHRHIQTNIKPGFHRRIRKAVRKAYAKNPDTIVFNEANAVTHAAIKRQAELRGYEVYIPSGAASQVCIVWRRVRFECLLERATFAGHGRAYITPHRYVVRVRLRDSADGGTVVILGTHTIASGWTGGRDLDAFRRHHWQEHMRVLRAVQHRAYLCNDRVIGSGDLNRPYGAWVGRKLLPEARYEDAATATLARTGPTHGRVRFDYTWVLSRHLDIEATACTYSQPSDHRAICADFTWSPERKKAR